MKTFITLFLFLLLSFTAAAQTGKLAVMVESTDSWEPATVTLLRNDSALRTALTNEGGLHEFRFLEEGTYNIRVSKKDHITSELKDIKVKEEETTSVRVVLNDVTKTASAQDDATGPYSAVILSAAIHPAIDSYTQSDKFVSTYRYGFGNTFYSHNANFLHLAYTQLLSVGGHRLKSNARINPYDVRGAEKYLFIDYALALSLRANLIRGNDPGQPKLFLETGAGYNIPIMYRHLAKDGDRTIYTKKINKFTETHAFARIGSKWLSFKVKYTLTDFIESSLPEPPRTDVSIEFLIPSY